MGHVAVADDDLLAPVREWRTLVGAIPGPMAAWLVRRSLATLEIRLERQCSNVLRVAQALRAHPASAECGSRGWNPTPRTASRSGRCAGFGPVVGFELADEEKAHGFLHAARLIAEATSFGGAHTTAERRGRWGGDDVAAGFIRLSAGCEDPDDLVEDISQALDAAAIPPPRGEIEVVGGA